MAGVKRPLEINANKFITDGGKLVDTKELKDILQDAELLNTYLNGEDKDSADATREIERIKAKYGNYKSWNNFIGALVAVASFNGPRAILGEEYIRFLQIAEVPELDGREFELYKGDKEFVSTINYKRAVQAMNMLFGVSKDGNQLDNSYPHLSSERAAEILDKSVTDGGWNSSTIDNEDLKQILNEYYLGSADKRIGDARIYLPTKYKLGGQKYESAHEKAVDYLSVYNWLESHGFESNNILNVLKVVCAPDVIKIGVRNKSIAEAVMQVKPVNRNYKDSGLENSFTLINNVADNDASSELLSVDALDKYIKISDAFIKGVDTKYNPIFNAVFNYIHEDRYLHNAAGDELMSKTEVLSDTDKNALVKAIYRYAESVEYHYECSADELIKLKNTNALCSKWFEVTDKHVKFVDGLKVTGANKDLLMAVDKKDDAYSAHLNSMICKIEKLRALHGTDKAFGETFGKCDKVLEELDGARAEILTSGKTEKELVADVTAMQKDAYDKLRGLNLDLDKLVHGATIDVVKKLHYDSMEAIKREEMGRGKLFLYHMLTNGGKYVAGAGAGVAIAAVGVTGAVSLITGAPFELEPLSMYVAIGGGAAFGAGAIYEILDRAVPALRNRRYAWYINYNLHCAANAMEKVNAKAMEITSTMEAIDAATTDKERAGLRTKYNKQVAEMAKINDEANTQIGYAQGWITKNPHARVADGGRPFVDRINTLNQIHEDQVVIQKTLNGEVDAIEYKDGKIVETNVSVYTGKDITVKINTKGKKLEIKKKLTGEELSKATPKGEESLKDYITNKGKEEHTEERVKVREEVKEPEPEDLIK